MAYLISFARVCAVSGGLHILGDVGTQVAVEGKALVEIDLQRALRFGAIGGLAHGPVAAPLIPLFMTAKATWARHINSAPANRSERSSSADMNLI